MPGASAPHSTTRRIGKRSAKWPITMPPRPVPRVAIEYASDRSARDQPNSTPSGSRNTAMLLIAPKPMATSPVHAATISQATRGSWSGGVWGCVMPLSWRDASWVAARVMHVSRTFPLDAARPSRRRAAHAATRLQRPDGLCRHGHDHPQPTPTRKPPCTTRCEAQGESPNEVRAALIAHMGATQAAPHRTPAPVSRPGDCGTPWPCRMGRGGS